MYVLWKHYHSSLLACSCTFDNHYKSNGRPQLHISLYFSPSLHRYNDSGANTCVINTVSCRTEPITRSLKPCSLLLVMWVCCLFLSILTPILLLLCMFFFLSQLLEYVGKGKSIMDVGLAQARQPLTTRCHYYEVEIVDAGEKCYIALGLARRVSFLRKEQLLTFLHLHSLFFLFSLGEGVFSI